MQSHTHVNLTMTLLLSGADDATGRLKKLITAVANQSDEKLRKLEYEREDVAALRQWLDIILKQAHQTRPSFEKLFSQLNEALEGMTVTRRPIMSLKERQLMFAPDADIPSNISAFAYIVGQAFNSDLFKRISRCPECVRRQSQQVTQGKPNDPMQGPYFVRGGTGDNRIYCTSRHSNAEMRRRDRARKRLQQKEQ